MCFPVSTEPMKHVQERRIVCFHLKVEVVLQRATTLVVSTCLTSGFARCAKLSRTNDRGVEECGDSRFKQRQIYWS